jgi:hypothetical protein
MQPRRTPTNSETRKRLNDRYRKKLERARTQAQSMLARMKPYEVWAAEVGGDSENARLVYRVIREALVRHIDDLHPDRPHHRFVRMV